MKILRSFHSTHNNFRDSDFQINFENPMFSRIILISLWFSNNLLFFPILNKHEGNFHNSETLKFVRLIHARSIGFWWDPTYVAFSLIYWLLCFINLLRSMTYTRLFCAYLLTFIFHEINRFITQVYMFFASHIHSGILFRFSFGIHWPTY